MKYKFTFLLFAIIVAMVGYYLCPAQVITFSAKDAQSSNALTLDSVKIQDLTQNKDTVVNTNSFNLSLFTSVKDGTNNYIFSVGGNYPNYFDDETRFDVTPDSARFNKY